MDEYLKKKIYWWAIIISIIVLIISFWGNYNTNKQIESQSIAVDRSPLQAVRFIDYRENRDGFFIDVVSLENGKKYENNFLSLSCPAIKNKKLGMIMKISAVQYFKPANNETFFRLDRAYEYLCTNLNMEQEDENLLRKIKEVREKEMKFQESLIKK